MGGAVEDGEVDTGSSGADDVDGRHVSGQEEREGAPMRPSDAITLGERGLDVGGQLSWRDAMQ